MSEGERAERTARAAYESYTQDVTRIGSATLLRFASAPDTPMLNRVVGLGVERPATEDELDGALREMADLRHYVAVSPAARPPELTGWLEARGYTPGWGWMLFARSVDDLPTRRSTVEIVRCGAEQSADFARIVVTSFGLPEASAAPIADARGHEGWHFFLALVDDRPAGTGALFVHDGAGYLGFGATLPELRGRGAQGALLAHRIRTARELGCDLVVTETGERRDDLPSSSYRNILRAGFREQHVVANWVSG